MRKEQQPVGKQLGIMVDQDLWRRFRAAAIMRDQTATELLEEAMRRALDQVSVHG
jgi:hypothetical protein